MKNSLSIFCSFLMLLAFVATVSVISPASAGENVTMKSSSTGMTCATSKQLRELSKHGNDNVRYLCGKQEEKKMTIYEAVDAMENTEIYYNDRSRNGFLVRFPGDLVFENGVAELPQESQMTLHRFANVLNNYDNAVVSRGHASTPNISTSEFPSNQELSEVRAESVADNLIYNHGVSADRLSTKGFGERLQYNEEINDATERLNRRVDFFIYN